jgi:hypothetical protein
MNERDLPPSLPLRRDSYSGACLSPEAFGGQNRE